jgi:hypothetical protein
MKVELSLIHRRHYEIQNIDVAHRTDIIRTDRAALETHSLSRHVRRFRSPCWTFRFEVRVALGSQRYLKRIPMAACYQESPILRSPL